MPLTYTTKEAIARRLKGRLKVTTTLSPHAVPSVNTQQVVDPDLIEDIGLEVEDKINKTLAQIYELPLLNQHPILAGIVTKLVIAELMPTQFQTTQFPEMGGDAGFGSLMRKQALEDLAMLTIGHGVPIIGIMVPPNMPGITTAQPIVLEGEKLRSHPPDTLTRNVTVITQTRGRALTDEARAEWGITWGSQRARGAERIWD